MSLQSISGAWPDHCTEKNVGQICYQLARLLGSIINVCFGQELVILYMLFLASKDDDTLLHEAGMVMEKKISLKTWKKDEITGTVEDCFSQPSLLPDIISLSWVGVFCFNKANTSFTEYTLATCQGIKDERMTVYLLQFGQESESSPGISSRKISSRALQQSSMMGTLCTAPHPDESKL